MLPTLPTWLRGRYSPGGGDALLFFVLFGQFAGVRPPCDRQRYRTRGMTTGLELHSYGGLDADERVRVWGEHVFAQYLAERPALEAAVRSAPGCLVMRHHVPDPRTLDYLRDAVGLVTFLMDNGGAAVLAPQQLRWRSAAEWREQVFAPARPALHQHVTALVSPEIDRPDAERRWVHTRGMRAFGRPDISMRGVPRADVDAAVELCRRFVELQGYGGRVPDGQAVRMQGLPEGLVCRHGGSLDDPDFNNRHIAIDWPPPAS